MSSLRAKKSSTVDEGGPTGEIFAEPPHSSPAADLVLACVHGVDAAGRLLVDYPGNPAGMAVTVQATGIYDATAVGRQVALAFIARDPTRPIALGLVREPVAAPPPPSMAYPGTVEVERDGERIELAARQEIVLRCGRASLTLTRAGKVLVRGAYVSLRSSGMQRITGASVHIN